MLIDWKKHTVELIGIDGCSPGMTPQTVLEFLEKQNDEVEVNHFAMVYWDEPKQFCLYGKDEFIKEVVGSGFDGPETIVNDA